MTQRKKQSAPATNSPAKGTADAEQTPAKVATAPADPGASDAPQDLATATQTPVEAPAAPANPQEARGEHHALADAEPPLTMPPMEAEGSEFTSAPRMPPAGVVPVRYVGKKDEKVDNVAGTGLVWTRGQVHLVPPLVAQKLARYPDVWKIISFDEVEEDPGQVGLVVTEAEVTPAAAPVKPEIVPRTFDLPNLYGMMPADIATFAASQFNETLPEDMDKDAMIARVVALANSRAAGEPV